MRRQSARAAPRTFFNRLLFTSKESGFTLHQGPAKPYSKLIDEYRVLQMKLSTYLDLQALVIRHGYEPDIRWCETVRPPEKADQFLAEYVWVILNGGLREQVARAIWQRVRLAIRQQEPLSTVFRHAVKVKAIQDALGRKEALFQDYLTAGDKLAYLESLPWIGPITKYHLFKSLGGDICKPDRHLLRLSVRYKTTPEELCRRLADQSGDRIGTVDYVVWRAANLHLNSTL